MKHILLSLIGIILKQVIYQSKYKKLKKINHYLGYCFLLVSNKEQSNGNRNNYILNNGRIYNFLEKIDAEN